MDKYIFTPTFWRKNMLKWLKKRKINEDPATKMVDVNKLNLPTSPLLTGAATIQYPTSVMSGTFKGNTPGGGVNLSNTVIGGTSTKYFTAMAGHGQFSIQAQQTSNLLSITGHQNQEIVRINSNGEVIWPNGYHIDEAAEIFSKSLYLSVECAAGIKASVKEKIRDAVFQEVINMANEKGTLTAEELTYLWQAAKIIDKLKGI